MVDQAGCCVLGVAVDCDPVSVGRTCSSRQVPLSFRCWVSGLFGEFQTVRRLSVEARLSLFQAVSFRLREKAKAFASRCLSARALRPGLSATLSRLSFGVVPSFRFGAARSSSEGDLPGDKGLRRGQTANCLCAGVPRRSLK
jgi:hypothetical protein